MSTASSAGQRQTRFWQCSHSDGAATRATSARAVLPPDAPQAWGAAAPVPLLVLVLFPSTNSSAISPERLGRGRGAAGAASARRAGPPWASSARVPLAHAMLGLAWLLLFPLLIDVQIRGNAR